MSSFTGCIQPRLLRLFNTLQLLPSHSILCTVLCGSTLKRILYLHPPNHALLNQLLIQQLNQPYYLVDSTKSLVKITLLSRIY